MEKNIRKLIDLIKDRVKANLQEINSNQDAISRIMAKHSEAAAGQSGQNEFNDRFNKNKELLDINDDLIKLQLHLVKFAEKYKDKEFLSHIKIKRLFLEDEYSKDEVFDLTVDEIIPFDEKHPFFKDDEFYNDLITYYVNREKYEICEGLRKKRGE
ncbi:MAG: hypothetical protein GVY19_05390 [Bacteroidetes bacterium]|jgi:hypothetical protein|nr:hypothetical protein [Bacteroidota bacterium]